ncbi:upf0481 protein [Cinnamomum micranthum f. kanehirae]|uniref:Upf0481 protein n=1 Tax=Cinnamomum micranthum f. kanehirae TaxID=337451 RepID=A0A3S3M7H8_9MAGN|nr:upf0481 protein [Cinnamomum micranthum f. kanehirae]
MAADQSNHDGTVPLSEEPKTREWLIEIMKGKEHDSQTKAKPQIQKVAGILRETESNQTCFDPLVVSFGPYHHGKPRLRPMESYKEVAARWFFSLSAGNKPKKSISDVEVKNVYDKFVAEATKELSPRENYADNFIDIYNQAEFMKMMFLDGCFILYFIHHLVVKVTDDLPESGHLNQRHILRDMFLLENQIPYSILKALMSLLPNRSFDDDVIIEFIYVVFLPPYEINLNNIGFFKLLFFIFKNMFFPKWNHPFKVFLRSVSDDRRKPLHLLDLLRDLLIGVGASPSSSGSGYWHYYFRPVRELKATGIQVRRSSVTLLSDVKFKKGLTNSHLELPQLIVDESTKTRLLNLVAYEMSSDGLLDRTVTSYICFLNSLIYNTEDVKELRSENILLNRLGSNDEVVQLFKELAAHSSPDYSGYGDVIKGIDEHCKRHLNHTRILIGQWTSQFTRTYFTSPWTVISLIAAIFVISLTLVQTIYTALSFYDSNKTD